MNKFKFRYVTLFAFLIMGNVSLRALEATLSNQTDQDLQLSVTGQGEFGSSFNAPGDIFMRKGESRPWYFEHPESVNIKLNKIDGTNVKSISMARNWHHNNVYEVTDLTQGPGWRQLLCSASNHMPNSLTVTITGSDAAGFSVTCNFS